MTNSQLNVELGLPWWLSHKESSIYNAGNVGSIPGWGRSHGEGNVTTFQHSCLDNLLDRGAQWVMVHGVARGRHDLATAQ